MRSNLNQAIKVFFNPETLLPFFIGAIFLSVFGNAVTQILFNTFGNSNLPVVSIGLGAILIFLLSVWLVARSLTKPQPLNIDLGKSHPLKHRGLILLVSRAEPCRQAIQYHYPALEICWVICSNETKKIGEDFQKEFTNLKIRDPLIVNDIFDPIECYRVVEKIYKTLPPSWRIEDVISDFTGMTAQASVGMVLACSSLQANLQYTPAELNNGKPTGNSLTPIEIVIR